MSRLSHLLNEKIKECQKTERQIASECGWSQQTLNTWRSGRVVPRDRHYSALSEFLGISAKELEKICEESRGDRPTKLPKLDLPVGIMSDRSEGKWKFPLVGGRRYPSVPYAIKVDTKVMEPAFHVGTIAKVDPTRRARSGDEVLVHSNGFAWIGVLKSSSKKQATINRHVIDGELAIDDVRAIHVITHSFRHK